MMNPLVSILIPVYNHESYLEECINSIWNQTYKHVEIIAIDDGSTDNSFLVLEHLDKISPVPMRIEKQSNHGIVKTLNKALQLATGDYILCLASDDKILDNALGPALVELLNEKSAQFAMFNAMYFGNVNRPVYSKKTDSLLKSNAEAILRHLYVEPPQPILLQSTIIRREFLISLGGWHESIVMDDWPMFIRLFECVNNKNVRWFYNGALFLAGYRIHGNNVHKDTVRQIRTCEEVIHRYCPDDLKNEAYANTYIDYSLKLIKRKDRNGLKLLLKSVSLSNILFVVNTIISRVYNYVRN